MGNSKESGSLTTQQRLGMDRRKFLYLLAGTVAAVATGCTYNKDPQSTNSAPTQPWDYFPTEVGKRWTYDITLGKDGNKTLDSLSYEDVNFPQLDGSTLVRSGRGRFGGSSSDVSKIYTLAISVASKAERQGPLQYPEGVKLKIEKDDLGIFYDNKEVFWAIKRTDGYRVYQVSTHEPSSYNPKNLYRDPDGYSMRVLLFGDKPGINLSIGKNSPDSLTFIGSEGSDLHFKRIVEAGSSKTSDGLGTGFTEDMWFRKSIGLTRLEQKVNGKTTMTWNLK